MNDLPNILLVSLMAGGMGGLFYLAVSSLLPASKGRSRALKPRLKVAVFMAIFFTLTASIGLFLTKDHPPVPDEITGKSIHSLYR